ncbi:hypothetical protein ACIQ7D_24130 [Streptomyces sp. NPDC096310]|uniref:hypothetical protein n=1 Tax=Streptomyces sp. NPDC096310 TaxID=3366082 RepID=UPI003800FFA8
MLRLALDVRRGEGRYPLDLDWLLPAGEFAPLRCPACDRSGAQLVAAKTHLGCARCLAPKRPTPQPAPASVPPPRDGAGAHTAASTAAPVRADTSVAARNVHAAADGASPLSGSEAKAGRTAATSPARASSQSTSRRATPGRAPSPPQRRSSDPRTLNKRAVAFWERAAAGDHRKLERLCVPDSPAAALLRLYSAAGPLYGIGVGSRERVESCSVAVFPAEGRRGWDGAGGEVHTDRGDHD